MGYGQIVNIEEGHLGKTGPVRPEMEKKVVGPQLKKREEPGQEQSRKQQDHAYTYKHI
jgi:hypothetical protein